MDYTKKYLKYKSKYFELKADLESKGYNVDELLKSMEVNQNGGGDAQTSDIFLSETPTNDQQGGLVAIGDHIYSETDAEEQQQINEAIQKSKQTAPVTPAQSNTTSTVRNVYHNTYIDPLYPYTYPVVRPTVYTVPTNTFPIIERSPTFNLYDDYDEPVRRTSRRRSSKRKTSKRRTSKRRSSKRRTSKRRTSRR